MSFKAKPQPTELDQIRDSVTAMVDIVGETRADVKVLDRKMDRLDRKMDRLEQKVDKQGSDIAELKADNAQLKADNAEIKEMLKALLSR